MDRGLIDRGYLADLNIIDLEGMQLDLPTVAFDLPAGGRRLLQTAKGYDCTIKSGKVTFRHGAATGCFPGGVIRGPQSVTAEANHPESASG
jgi:N-acyl-D-amino-acid deacylase